MIARIAGKLLEKRHHSIILENNGICYEIFLPLIALARIEDQLSAEGSLKLITYHYHHLEPSRSIPVLIGFLTEVEKDFFEEFITVSGIGPKAALRAINMPISLIAKAIDEGDQNFLKTLPGIGPQRAKEIIAKLQGRIGKFGLIQDAATHSTNLAQKDFMEEAVEVLIQLQYKKNEAKQMAHDALKKQPDIKNIEELLNIVYKQKNKK